VAARAFRLRVWAASRTPWTLAAVSGSFLPSHLPVPRGLVSTRICSAFSDCTTAPRNGLVSGCYPLDEL